MLELPDDGKHYELIEGELILNPSPVPRHQSIVRNIAVHLTRISRSTGADKRSSSPLDVVPGRRCGGLDRISSLCRQERLSIVGRTIFRVSPSLVVEVLSDKTRRRDQTVKRRLYERYGVDEYWIADPVIDVLKIYRRSGDALVRAGEISAETGGMITSPLLPGFTLDVNVVFDV